MKQENHQNLIKIGALLPLTGKNRRYGQWIREVLEMGRQEINLEEGINGKELEIEECSCCQNWK